MAYEITRSNGSDKITIADGTPNSTPPLSVPLVGRNTVNYGQSIATTQLYLLENFANSTEPANAVLGQLWYDTTAGLKVKITGDAGVSPDWASFISSEGGGDIGTETDPKGNIYTENLYVQSIFPLDPAVSTQIEINGDWVLAAGSTLQATYADLAERFESDAVYSPGTVVSIGGAKEITESSDEFDIDVIGVVSTDPAFLLNAKAGFNETHPPVALAGRIPTKVVGPVTKGQRIVTSATSGAGRAVVAADLDSVSTYAIIGRALESCDKTDERMIMVFVGSK